MIWTQITTTYCMFGLIWLIQLVHYPAFRYVASDDFAEFHEQHTKRISVIVIPLMLAELITAFWLALDPATAGLGPWLLLGLTFLIWLSTFALQVPIHQNLKNGKDMELIQQLIYTNWFRTSAWTIKAILIYWWLMEQPAPE